MDFLYVYVWETIKFNLQEVDHARYLRFLYIRYLSYQWKVADGHLYQQYILPWQILDEHIHSRIMHQSIATNCRVVSGM